MARPRKSIVNPDSESVNNTEVTVVADEQQTVKVYAPVAVNVMLTGGVVAKLVVGVNEVAPEVADHWYAVANGVRPV